MHLEKLPGPEKISREEIREQTDRILTSPQFKDSKQLSIFFSFVIKETLAGEGDGLKAYTIAVEAFGRAPDFDPQIDPFIRVLAGRMRRALKMYYFSEGKNDPVVIDIPKGSYVPVFSRRSEKSDEDSAEIEAPGLAASDARQSGKRLQEKTKLSIPRKLTYAAIFLIFILLSIGLFRFFATPTADTGIGHSSPPAIIVLPFKQLNADTEYNFLTHSLPENLSNRLSLFNDLAVISYYSARSLHDNSKDIFASIRDLGVNYALTGSFLQKNDKIRLTVQLIDMKSNQQLWSRRYERKLTVANIFNIVDEIAENIVGQIGGGYGVIFREMTYASLAKRSTQLSVYEAIALFRAYGYSPSTTLFRKALPSLQKAVTVDPYNALAWAMLSNLYLDAYTLALAPIDSAFEKGAKCIRKAVQLAPRDPYVRSIEGFFYRITGEKDKALKALDISILVNPNNGYLVGVCGWEMVLLGEFERGLALMKQGIKLNPYYPGYFHLAYFLEFFRKGEYTKALAEVDNMNLPNLFWDPMLRTVALVKLGRMEEARQAYRRIIKLRPDFPERKVFYIKNYIYPDEMVGRFISALETAADK